MHKSITDSLHLSQSFRLMAHSHCPGTELGQVQEVGLGLMGPNILYRNVHTGLRQEQEPEPIVSYCAGPVPCTCSVPVPVQCE